MARRALYRPTRQSGIGLGRNPNSNLRPTRLGFGTKLSHPPSKRAYKSPLTVAVRSLRFHPTESDAPSAMLRCGIESGEVEWGRGPHAQIEHRNPSRIGGVRAPNGARYTPISRAHTLRGVGVYPLVRGQRVRDLGLTRCMKVVRTFGRPCRADMKFGTPLQPQCPKTSVETANRRGNSTFNANTTERTVRPVRKSFSQRQLQSRVQRNTRLSVPNVMGSDCVQVRVEAFEIERSDL